MQTITFSSCGRPAGEYCPGRRSLQWTGLLDLLDLIDRVHSTPPSSKSELVLTARPTLPAVPEHLAKKSQI